MSEKSRMVSVFHQVRNTVGIEDTNITAVIRWVQRSTYWGWDDVQADGSMVSRALEKPCKTLKRETLIKMTEMINRE